MGFDTIGFWARSGSMASLGEPDSPFVIQRVTTAIFLFAGTMLALHQRERTGKGSLVDASLLASGTWVASENLWAALFTGKANPRYSRKSPSNPLLNDYRCSDDKWVHITILQTDRHWHNFCRAIGTDNLEQDPRFDSHEHRTQNPEQRSPGGDSG